MVSKADPMKVLTMGATMGATEGQGTLIAIDMPPKNLIQKPKVVVGWDAKARGEDGSAVVG